MTNTYFSTFISGLSEVIPEVLCPKIEDPTIKTLLDGLIMYETDSPLETIKKLPFLNNSFYLLKSLQSEGSLSELLKEVSKELQFPKIQFEGKTFRVIISKENELQHVTPSQLKELEALFSEKLHKEVDRANPDLEVWFLERSEGYFFCGIRLTKKPSTDKYLKKGELRPELAWILNFLSEPKATDVFLDPFAGHGSIPHARIQFPFKKIIASDLHQELITSNNNIEIHDWDALNLPLENNSIDKIVTDPPWGSYEQVDIESFYPKMLKELERVMKVDGILVLVTAQKELFEKLIQENNAFQLESQYNILVSGKKSGIYKLKKNS